MPWVQRNGYSPGKRHFVEGVVRTFTSEPLPRPHIENDTLRYQQFVDKTTSPTLCAEKEYGRSIHWAEDGYICTNAVTGKVQHKSGGLGVKEKINLMQRNLCAYCLKHYIAARPEMKAAVDALKQAQVISDD